MEQQSSRNPKAGYKSFFTNYKQENSGRKGQASFSGQRHYENTTRTLTNPSSTASQYERNIIEDKHFRYSSAPLNSQGSEQVNPRSKSQSTTAFKSKEYGSSRSQSYPSLEDANNSELDIRGSASTGRVPWNWPAEVVSGRTEVEWEKQRVQEMNMEWRQGHEKWRTRAEEVMQGYARELEKSLQEFPDALLKCP